MQTTYVENIGNGFVGQIADLTLTDVISRTVETSGGIDFGIAVIQGTDDHQCKLGAAGTFLGITVRDVTLPVSNGDKYLVKDEAAIMTRGSIFVTAPAAITAGEAVYRTAAGVLTNVSSGNTLVANARFETSGAQNALVRVRLI